MKRAFTLVELLVSIGIIATLTAILLPNFMGARDRARDAQRIQDVGAMKNALRMYYNDNQAYPTPVGAGNTLGVGMSAYTTSQGIGYTYWQNGTNTDGFAICIPLENGQGDDELDSQRKCNTTCDGGTVGEVEKLYVVCAN